MKIVLATPLYPPDIAEPAPYVKELAMRLSARHTVTIVAYTHLPEQIEGVDIIAIDKRKPVLVRLVQYTYILFKTVHSADIVFGENGSSVELPLLLITLFTRKRVVLHLGDKKAHERNARHFLRHLIEKILTSHVYSMLTDMPMTKPEVIPFMPYPQEELTAWESSWRSHIARIDTLLPYAA